MNWVRNRLRAASEHIKKTERNAEREVALYKSRRGEDGPFRRFWESLRPGLSSTIPLSMFVSRERPVRRERILFGKGVVGGLVLLLGVPIVLGGAILYQTKVLNQPFLPTPSDYEVVDELWSQPFKEVTEQPSINDVRGILMYPMNNGRFGHVDRPWGLQVVGYHAPLTFWASVCNILPSDELIELGKLEGGLIVAEFRSDRSSVDTGCASGDVVIAKPEWFK